jgi:hypothetical protein
MRKKHQYERQVLRKNMVQKTQLELRWKIILVTHKIIMINIYQHIFCIIREYEFHQYIYTSLYTLRT